MIPPIWLNIRVGWILIPLPIIFFWPLGVILWLSGGVILSVFILGCGDLKAIRPIWAVSWNFLCACRGTRIDVRTSQANVQISII